MPYKSDSDRCGIYTITSPSGKMYVGSSINIPARWNKHLSKLKNDTHHNAILKSAWKKYGKELEFKQILICEPEDLVFYEQLIIDAYKPYYNLSPTAGNTLGYKHTPAALKKMKETPRPPQTEEHRLKNSLGNKGRKHPPRTEEWKQKQSLKQKGKKRGPQTPEHIAKRFISRLENKCQAA